MMKHELFICIISFLVGMIVAFYASIFVIGIDCNSEPETVDIYKHNNNQVILELNLPSK